MGEQQTCDGSKDAANDNLTTDERIALELYSSTRKNNPNTPAASKGHGDASSSSESDSHEDVMEKDMAEKVTERGKEAAEEDDEERRGITYQIFKNKGLAPKRGKLQRNPRVKHRHKFEKAKIRRKGQVREVRTETKKYAGEMSGINMRVKKGIKLM